MIFLGLLAACRTEAAGKLSPGLEHRLASSPRQQAWALVDLYDLARVTGRGRSQLARRLGLRPEASLQTVNRALARRLGLRHPARRLLDWDLSGVRSRRDVLVLRRLLGSRGPVQANAALRAASVCLQGFWAALARPWERVSALGWCHLVLTGSEGRVLAGRGLGASELALRARELLRVVRRPGLREAGARLLRYLEAVASSLEAAGPESRGLARVGWAFRWSGAPVVRFSDGRVSWRGAGASLAASELRPFLTDLLGSCPLRHLLLAVSGETAFGRLLPVVRAAVLTGFESLGLGVESPEGLFGEVRVSLLSLASWTKGPRLSGPACPPRHPLAVWSQDCYRLSVGMFPDGLVLQTADRCWSSRTLPRGSRSHLLPPEALRLVAQVAREGCSLAVYVHPEVTISGLVSLLSFLHRSYAGLRIGLRLDWPECEGDSESPTQGSEGLGGTQGPSSSGSSPSSSEPVGTAGPLTRKMRATMRCRVTSRRRTRNGTRTFRMDA